MKFLTVLGFILLLAAGTGLYYLHLQNELLKQQITVLSVQIDQLEEANTVLANRVSELEEDSLSSVVDQAGEAIVEGWQSMLKSVEEELEKAQQKIQEQREKSRQDDTVAPEKTGEKVDAVEA
jgi:uncharacterized protein HemX